MVCARIKQFLGICIEIPSRVDFIHELMKLTCDIEIFVILDFSVLYWTIWF